MINIMFYIIWFYKADKHTFIQFKPCYIFDKCKIYIVDNMFWVLFGNLDNRNLFDCLLNLTFLFFRDSHLVGKGLLHLNSKIPSQTRWNSITNHFIPILYILINKLKIIWECLYSCTFTNT